MEIAWDDDLMTGDRRKEIVCHLSEDDLDRLLAETDDEKISKRLTFVKRLYKGATLEDAADDVGSVLERCAFVESLDERQPFTDFVVVGFRIGRAHV